MINNTERLHIDGPCGDWHTHNLILQVADWEHGIGDYQTQNRRENIEYALKYLLELQQIPQDTADQTKLLQELLEKKGKAFQHTSEYYAAIEDERKRIEAYRDLQVVSTVPYGEDAEIAANPCKFLYLPEDATFPQIRDAYFRLSKKWHPDLIRPENREQYDRIFGTEPFPIEGKIYEAWVEKILESSPPKTLTTEQLDKLNPQQQEEYRQKKQAYREKEMEYDKVKAEMSMRANQKQQILNKAYKAAKNRFSDKEINSFAGFEWEKMTLSGGDDLFHFDYNILNLEAGNAQLQKDMGEWARNDAVYLAYDFGFIEDLSDEDHYRQKLYLRPFFAWMELRQGQGLCPTLLEDITKACKFTDDQAEQLRLMIINHQAAEFILATLNISPDDNRAEELLSFLNDIYEGPKYSEPVGWESDIYHPLGVEITEDDELVLIYGPFGFDKIQLPKIDVQVMRAIAYGPLLQESN